MLVDFATGNLFLMSANRIGADGKKQFLGFTFAIAW